jgi:guanylate kinase
MRRRSEPRGGGPATGGGPGRQGILFVLSAPSGTGKTTISRRLLRLERGLRFSVSHTTRVPRPGERQGVDYYFVSEARFRQLRQRGEFLEWAMVDGAFYGTSRRLLKGPLARTEDILLDIDTQGAEQVRRRQKGAVLIFVLPPGPQELRKRHRRRGTDSLTVARRLRLARREVSRCGKYDYVVVNDRLESAVRDIAAIIRAERSRTTRQRRRIAAIRRALGASRRSSSTSRRDRS